MLSEIIIIIIITIYKNVYFAIIEINLKNSLPKIILQSVTHFLFPFFLFLFLFIHSFAFC